MPENTTSMANVSGEDYHRGHRGTQRKTKGKEEAASNPLQYVFFRFFSFFLSFSSA